MLISAVNLGSLAWMSTGNDTLLESASSGRKSNCFCPLNFSTPEAAAWLSLQNQHRFAVGISQNTTTTLKYSCDSKRGLNIGWCTVNRFLHTCVRHYYAV